MKLLGIRIVDNDFTGSLWYALEKVIKSSTNWREILTSNPTRLKPVLALMTAQHQAITRPSLYIVGPVIYPFDLDSLQEATRSNYEYLMGIIEFMEVDNVMYFPGNWDNNEAIVIDLETGYMWAI